MTPTQQKAMEMALEALQGQLRRDYQNTCTHEETYRGGTIWTICHSCDAKWADDEGGMPDWKDPPEWGRSEHAIEALRAALAERQPLFKPLIDQLPGLAEELAEQANDKTDMTIKLPPMPEPDHKFVDLEGEAPDIHVWNQASLEAYAREAVRLNMAPLSDERGVRPLAWTDERQPDDACPYNHCIAETPFGSFLITWKGWKDYPSPTADETPWGEWFGMGWDTVDEAKAACEQEFARRVALCLAA